MDTTALDSDQSPGQDKRLYSAQRRQAILHTLAVTGRVDVAAMADELSVTSETVRKDLIALERQGQLRRVHGGAIPVHGLSFEPDVSARVEFADEKRRIAKAALAHLPPSGTILVDAGSTTERLAELIPADRRLTAFTNTLPIALTLAGKAEHHRLHARRTRPQPHLRRGGRLGRPHAQRDQRRRRLPRQQRDLP